MSGETRERIRELTRRAGLGEIDPKVTATAAALGVVAVLAAAWWWWPRGAGGATPVMVAESGASALATATASFETSSDAAPPLVVHVVGAVRRPGVYRLPPGSRTEDAVAAAGGELPDAVLAALNLARPLTDGEQVLVPTEDEVAAGTTGAGAAGGARGAGRAGAQGGAAAHPGGGSLVDLNTADVSALDTLPGVGPSTAEKIIADREANGPFESVDDLGRVSGIGPKKLEQLRELVCVR